MAEEKNFLQTIKLEISRSFKLVPYERLAFHKIMGILTSDIGMSILIKELEKGPDIRLSAIAALMNFKKPEVLAALLLHLKKNISDTEKIMILDHVKKYGGMEVIGDIIQFIESLGEKPSSFAVLSRAFDVLSVIAPESQEVMKYLMEKVNAAKIDPQIKSLAIQSLSSFKIMQVFEEILKSGNDGYCYSVYRAIYSLAVDLADRALKNKTDDDRLFTYSPDSEDKIILDIRVLLGKLTHAFDSYSSKTKIAFICAMIASNHREFLIYTMKALTSTDTDLVSMTLYSLYQNISRVRDPDKLFRNLIAISTEVDRFNELIVDIFVKFFSVPVDSRPFHLLKDKLFGYIVVTLESYFESYRKEFMITDVIEKGLPESFQRIRKFMLNNCTPDLKKEIMTFLNQDDPTHIKHIIDDISRKITYIAEVDRGDLSLLLEVLLDRDRKSRENSSSRIEDLSFEKLYLRNRIIRLCRIIGFLRIDEAASVLVNVYNYLKKYPDKEILEATIRTLSVLNYSYMLGEIEIMITTGMPEDQKNAFNLLSLFTEQRSLNIILEFLKTRITDQSETVGHALSILLERDINGNNTANQIFKGIISSNQGPAIRSMAILGVGLCGFDFDIDYLNDLFYKMGQDEPKDVIVRAMASIMTLNPNFNKRQLMRHIQEYLKDPGIKVRIYSCLMLAQLGSKDALRSIRDMLIIKNKGIQRDILTIIGNLKSIEFSFFLLSLMKEEYGISKDITPVIMKLPLEDIKEIDGFVVNIFRKYEAPDLEGVKAHPVEQADYLIDGVKSEKVGVLNIVISEESLRAGTQKIPDLINLNLRIKTLIASLIGGQSGVITKMTNDNIVAYFADPISAASAAIKITASIEAFNATRTGEKSIDLRILLLTETVKIINEEIIEFPYHLYVDNRDIPVKNKIMIDGATKDLISGQYSLREIPQVVLSGGGSGSGYFELLSPINFLPVAEGLVKTIREEEEKRAQMQQQIEAELKKLKRERRSTSSVAIARELDNLAGQLQNHLDEIERYVQKRSTDRELIKNVRRMLTNIQNLYKVEISRIIID